MEKKWTPAQSAAMNIRNKTLLVSAAAGSGKTATLTERIIRSLTDPSHPSDISKMLIVTFTRAAAEDLKNRIFSALGRALARDPSNRHLNTQLVKLGSARICTIDSFYLDLVHSHFSDLGIPASLRIGDGVELEVLKRAIMEESVDFFYDTDEQFPAFAECFTATRSADRLTDILLALYTSVSSVPEGIEFLRINAEQTKCHADRHDDFFSTAYGAVLRSRAIDRVQYCYSIFESACRYLSLSEEHAKCLLPSFEHDRIFCLSLLDALRDEGAGYHRTKTLLESFKPLTLKRMSADFATEESEEYKKLRTGLHKQIRDLAQKSFSKDEDSIIRAMADTARYIDLLRRVLTHFETAYTEEKLRRGVMEFNDVRRLTLRLLVDQNGDPTPIAKQYAREFTDIYIDEYQDVDRVQDMIFRAISSPTNRFMVGDIKQSIYGFRGAEPQVFADYRSGLPNHEEADGSDGATVFMSENFRCDQSIIRFTNLICSRMFSACAESIGYCEDDDLVFSKHNPPEDYQATPAEVVVLSTAVSDTELVSEENEDKEPPEKFEIEAAYIAAEIHRLITEEHKADGTPIFPGDIAVLFRSRRISSYLVEALKEYGIPSSESDGDRYFENPDVLMVLCLLNTIDNPHRDIFLAGTLRSPIFGFSMEDLILIRQGCDDSYSLYDALLSRAEGEDPLADRCREFAEILNRYRQGAMALPVDRFLRTLFESDRFIASGLVSDRTESGDGGNLLQLYEYARTFEAGSFKGLYNFIEFINTVIEEDKKMKVPPKGTSPDRVNLMTIHQSKGLEFPVCFICGAGGRFNREDQKNSLLYEYPIGVAMKLSDSTGFARINTPLREALAANNAIRQSEEEMRVLYVALTRARERLYVTATSKESPEKLMAKAASRAKFSGRYTLLSCSSYLDWILIPLADPSSEKDFWRLSFYSAEELPRYSISSSEENLIQAQQETPHLSDRALYEDLKEKFSFRYPFADFRRIPAKMTVSRLSPNVLDENDTSVELVQEQKKNAVPDFFITGKPSRASAAERGTATHLFLQFCDFPNAKRKGVKEELERLVEKQFLPRNLADLVYVEELEKFLGGELMAKIEEAKEIIREQRFNLFLSPEHLTCDPDLRRLLRDEQMAVQGVVDLVLVDSDGHLGLYDYKTDRLSTEELKDPSLAAKRINERHGLQLSYYAKAVSVLFDRPCDRVCVYSTHAGRLFDIDLLPLTVPEKLIDTL